MTKPQGQNISSASFALSGLRSNCGAKPQRSERWARMALCPAERAAVVSNRLPRFASFCTSGLGKILFPAKSTDKHCSVCPNLGPIQGTSSKVLRGTKQVEVFPPSQTPMLGAFPVSQLQTGVFLLVFKPMANRGQTGQVR